MDLSPPCDIEFIHVFEEEAQARSMAEAVKPPGGRVELLEPEELEEEEIEESVWEVVYTFTIVPTHEDITARETELSKTAQSPVDRADGCGVMHG